MSTTSTDDVHIYREKYNKRCTYEGHTWCVKGTRIHVSKKPGQTKTRFEDPIEEVKMDQIMEYTSLSDFTKQIETKHSEIKELTQKLVALQTEVQELQQKCQNYHEQKPKNKLFLATWSKHGSQFDTSEDIIQSDSKEAVQRLMPTSDVKEWNPVVALSDELSKNPSLRWID